MRRTLVLASFLACTSAVSAQASDISSWNFGSGDTITWGDVEELRKTIFETFDADGDGALSNEEYTAFDKSRAEAAGKDASSLLLRAVSGLGRENTDLNLDGSVTRSEMETALRSWFDRIDRDKDGVITKGEY
ncbi:MAG: EF-hand domain-containing protein [Shimia sp.]|uniref:EF-hand domain-containing protein n=1 Tax=Shimia sp. TaxID=1954381 RepID=UPI003B8D47B3